jgi:hypothetical protein
VQQLPLGQGLLIREVSRSRTVTYHNRSDQLVAKTSTWQHTTLTRDRYPCHPVGFEPTISAGKRPQTYALERAATGTGMNMRIVFIFCRREVLQVITSVIRGNVCSIPVYLYLLGNSITESLITNFGGSEKWSRCRVSMGNRTRVVASHFVDPLPAHCVRVVLQERKKHSKYFHVSF